MLQSLKARLAAVSAHFHRVWKTERIPCWTDYLHETADRD